MPKFLPLSVRAGSASSATTLPILFRNYYVPLSVLENTLMRRLTDHARLRMTPLSVVDCQIEPPGCAAMIQPACSG